MLHGQFGRLEAGCPSSVKCRGYLDLIAGVGGFRLRGRSLLLLRTACRALERRTNILSFFRTRIDVLQVTH